MDAARETYRAEMARRGRTSATAVEEMRGRFLSRLGDLRREQSLRTFGEAVGIPHSTINAWYKTRARPTALHLQQIAERAELPGVPKGQLSVDWLLGRSEVPNRVASAELLAASEEGHSRGEDMVRLALLELTATLPLQSHLTFEWRQLSAVAIKIAGALMRRYGKGEAERAYRESGRLIGKCIEAPLVLLNAGISETRIAQGYVSGIAHALELIADDAGKGNWGDMPSTKRKTSLRTKRRK